ncbi:MAG: nucleoside kinase [Bacteroidales bacterium]|nr:nucleoside kinase [Bacteroidales bacterium]
MGNMLRIYCKNTGTSLEFQEGVTLAEALTCFEFDRPCDILCAKVNNVTQGLKYRAFNSRDVEFLDYRSYAGRSAYCRSLCFLLSKAAHDTFPGSKIKMRRPISKGYYCELCKGSPVTPEDVERIKSRMKEIVEGNAPFKRVEVRNEEAIRIFSSLGYDDKVKLLETSGQPYIRYHTLEGSPDYYYDALVPSAGYLKVWELSPYEDGMLLRVPDRHAPDRLTPFEPQPKTFEVFRENMRWNAIMHLDNVGDVNHACEKGHAGELIQVAEALQEKKIVKIAEEIEERYRNGSLRLVLITGPSSSGKTTVTKRLSTQLMACGLRPVSVSTDDYFVNRLDTPRFPDGSFDFDNFDTVDHDAMQEDLLKLLNGEEVSVPEYNFVTGLREFNGKTLKVDDGTVLLVEGIHALNPALTAKIPDEAKYKIFINTIISISLDDHNCIPTSDNRLLRRIVRDFNKGAFTARETISNWPNVRRAEVKWIYPFQETADVLFNSAYLVEFAVIRVHAEQILSTVPRNCPEYSEANRLLKFLSYFTPVSDREIPPTSLLREFVGGSSFKY